MVEVECKKESRGYMCPIDVMKLMTTIDEEGVEETCCMLKGNSYKNQLKKPQENILMLEFTPQITLEEGLKPVLAYREGMYVIYVYEPVQIEKKIPGFSSFFKNFRMPQYYRVYYELRSIFKFKKSSNTVKKLNLLGREIYQLKKEDVFRKIDECHVMGIAEKDMSQMIFIHPVQNIKIRLTDNKLDYEEIAQITEGWLLGQKVCWRGLVENGIPVVEIVSSYESVEDCIDVTNQWQEVVAKLNKKKIPLEWVDGLKNIL